MYNDTPYERWKQRFSTKKKALKSLGFIVFFFLVAVNAKMLVRGVARGNDDFLIISLIGFLFVGIALLAYNYRAKLKSLVTKSSNKQTKNHSHDELEKRIVLLFYIFSKNNLAVSKKSEPNERNADNLISVVQFITSESLNRAGYTIADLDKNQAMIVMIVTFIIADAVCYYIPILDNTEYSPEFISSIVSVLLFTELFHEDVGKVYSEGMDIYNSTKRCDSNVNEILRAIGKSVIEFFESQSNDKNLLLISKGMKLLVENVTLY